MDKMINPALKKMDNYTSEHLPPKAEFPFTEQYPLCVQLGEHQNVFVRLMNGKFKDRLNPN